ncbi:hypothetical protein Adt_10695 [Abeliophyllum distichum]|uniref:Uncharacterized protein n=1 Tax=Abeliophyllum distichum TaxID=126358 RepID=A0ABD1UKQ7_9LAMI
MSSGSDDSQNQLDVRTNPSIRSESPSSSSSFETVEEVNQAPSASCPLNPSTGRREACPTVPLKKVMGKKRTDAGIPEMRGSLDKRDVPVVKMLDEELRRSATEASMVRSRITAEDFEDIRLSYDIPASVTLRALGLEERADNPPEGFVSIYEPVITPNGWGQMVASYLLRVVAKAGGNLTPREFEFINWPCRSAGWYNVSPRPGQKWRTATDSPNKVHNWNERFFFVGGDWEFMLEDLLLYVSIPRRFRELDCGKPPISKRDQGELRLKWDKVRALSSDFRILSNLLKDDNLFASCKMMAFRFKEVFTLRLARPTSKEGSSAQAPWHEASGPSQEVQDTTPSSTMPRHLLRDKGKRIAEAGEVATQKRKAPAAAEGLMRDARKARQTEEGCRSLSPEEAGNSASSASQRCHFLISKHHEELPVSVMEMLPNHPAIVVTSIYRYWTQSREKATEDATVHEWLQPAKVNLARGFVLAKELFNTFESFDAEEAKSKKLFEDLKAMGLEKAQLESEKRALQFKLDFVITKEADMKAKYEIELNAAKECLK